VARLTSRRLRASGAIAAAAGAALFVWSLHHAGAAAVLDGVKRVGGGIVVVWLLGGIRGLVRAAAWRLCLDREQRVGIGAMFAAYLAGDALGNVTPFGFLISEPSKVVLLRRRIDLPSSVAALTVENLFYSSTVIVMLALGTAVLLLSFAVPNGVRIASIAMLAAAFTAAGATIWIVCTRRHVFSTMIEWLIRRNIAAAYWQARLPHIRRTGDLIFGFIERRRAAVLPLMLLECLYHAAAVAEIWFAVTLITGVRPDLVIAFLLEYVNRTITIAFQFVPMWLGVDEAGTSLATDVLRLGPAAGVSLALVRKARVVMWTAIGLALLVHNGVSLQTAGRDAGLVARHEVSS
jgi:Lysylphosphatidylglycerol synthase TM region